MKKTAVKDEGERYLKLPNRILNMRELSLPTRLLLAYIDSFGRDGCWSNNQTLAAMFDVSTRTITERIGQLKKAKRIWWLHPRSPYRIVWSNTHPDVKAADTLFYRGREILKTEILHRSFLPSNQEGSFHVTSQNHSNPHGSIRPTDKNNIRNGIMKNIIAMPSPLPACGQAPALLQDRYAEQQEDIQRFKSSFGRQKKRQTPEITTAERQQRIQAQKRTLLAGEAARKVNKSSDF